MILGTAFLLIALYALATAVVPAWRRAAIPRWFSGKRYHPLSGLGLASTFAAVGLSPWLAEFAPQFDQTWLFIPAGVGFILLIAGMCVDAWHAWVKVKQCRSLTSPAGDGTATTHEPSD